MTYGDMMYTLPGYGMQVAALLLFMGWILACRQMIRQRRSRGTVLLAVLNAAVSSLLFGILMNERERSGLAGATLWFHELCLRAYRLPWFLFLALEAGSAALLFLLVRSVFRFSRRNVTPDAIKEMVDLLPTGVCFGNEKGEVLLANIHMTDLGFALTNRLLQDTRVLWAAVTERGEEQDGRYLVPMEDGKAYLFSRSGVSMNGQEYTQITAADMTEQARITADLKSRNAKLWEVQYRMKDYHARAADMLMDEEMLTARTEIHDGLGHLLLMGRNYLAHPEKTDERELLDMMKRLNGSFMADAEEPPRNPDPYAEALKRAGRLGVQVHVEGTVPSGGRSRSLVGYALNECVANAVKHAGGNAVRARLEDQGGFMTAVFTSNGSPPAAPIQETGGLLSLRRRTEGMGGTMEIETGQCFRMTLWFPLD